MLSSNEIRSAFIDFFKDKGHQFVPSAPVVPMANTTILLHTGQPIAKNESNPPAVPSRLGRSSSSTSVSSGTGSRT